MQLPTSTEDRVHLPQLWPVIAAGGLSILICLLTYFLVQYDRERTIDDWRARALMVAQVLAGHAQQSLQL